MLYVLEVGAGIYEFKWSKVVGVYVSSVVAHAKGHALVHRISACHQDWDADSFDEYIPDLGELLDIAPGDIPMRSTGEPWYRVTLFELTT